MAEGNESRGAEVPAAAIAEHPQRAAVAALLAGAVVWGLIWYPYRILRDAGIGGLASTSLSYAVALILAALIWRPRPTRLERPWLMLCLALAAGGCNLGYVMATLTGEVMRVLLLFYLAPLWTVLLSRIFLGEHLNRFGAFVILLALAGAATMLWQPGVGFPMPHDAADWMGLGAGFCFALYNVLSRRVRDVPVEQRVMVSFAGVIVVGAFLAGAELPATVAAPASAWLLLLLIGVLLLAVNLVVQFGLANTPSNQAIVILLSEVGFAAVFSWLLAGEVLGLQEWAGGVMILAASLFTTRMTK